MEDNFASQRPKFDLRIHVRNAQIQHLVLLDARNTEIEPGEVSEFRVIYGGIDAGKDNFSYHVR